MMAGSTLTAEAAAQDKLVAAQVEAEDADGTLPQTASRLVPPAPADLDARRNAAPAAISWEVAEKLIQSPQGQQARGAKGEANASPAQQLGEIAIENLGGERSATRGDARGEGRGDARGEGQGNALSTANRLAASQSQQAGNLSQLAQADGTTRGADGTASSPIGDTSFVGRAAGAMVNAPASTPAGVQDVDLAQLVDRLVESRVQARADRNQIELQHQDFGRVTLALGLQKDDRLSIDLPGAPNELRQAVGQAINATSRSETTSNNTNSGNTANGNSTTSNSSAQGEAGGNADRQPGEARDNARQQDNRRGDGQAQQRGTRTGANTTSQTASGAADESRRGVLA